MNKDELHSILDGVKKGGAGIVSFLSRDFVDAYGNDDSRMFGKQKRCRADILADVYDLTVIKNSNDFSYTFMRKEYMEETNEKLLAYCENHANAAYVQIKANGDIEFNGPLTVNQLQDILEILGLNT